MPDRAPRLAERIAAALPASGAPAIIGPHDRLDLRALAEGGFVEDADTLAGRTVLIRCKDPLAAVAALASLDGLAARLVLSPPDLGAEALAYAARAAEVGGVATDAPDAGELAHLPRHSVALADVPCASGERSRATEWVLFTSGTSGVPKMVGHGLEALTDAMPAPAPLETERPVWATFYDPRRYGGLQMLLRALTGGFGLLVTDASEPLGDFLQRIGEAGATHVAGTPSHWRRVLMTPAAATLAPRYIRLSGEVADQGVLDALRTRFPDARIAHAYASTEAGVGFEVGDGLAGFPASLLERTDGPVEIRVVDGTLRLRSARAASGYLGAGATTLRDGEGWVDSGDLVERRGERVHFLGRRSGVINVGGLKVSPEEVEGVINACPGVRMSRVAARSNPLLGALVSAEVVLESGIDPASTRAVILERCRAALPPHKAPASLRMVPALEVGAAGKLERRVA